MNKKREPSAYVRHCTRYTMIAVLLNDTRWTHARARAITSCISTLSHCDVYNVKVLETTCLPIELFVDRKLFGKRRKRTLT
jgi:hypothetical protein